MQFSVSIYLVAAAGGMSVIAAACNLLKRHQPIDNGGDQQERLIDDIDGLGMGVADPYGPLDFITPPPPPPYAP